MFSLVRELFLKQKRYIKQTIASFVDLVTLYLSMVIVSFTFAAEISIFTNLVILLFPILTIFTFYTLGVYRSVLRYIDFSSIGLILKALMLSHLLYITIGILSLAVYSYFITLDIQKVLNLQNFQTLLVYFLLCSFFVLGIRIFANSFLRKTFKFQKVAIYGAGSAGIQLAGALRVSKEIQPVAFIDKNPSLHGTFLGGIKVLHPSKLEKLVSGGKIDEVLIAMPSASKSILRSLLKEIEKYSIRVRILPGLAELAQGKILVSELKEVDISDLLGRYEVEANQELINKNIDNKVVLITGAGGSIGSEISRQVARHNAKKVILLDSNEYALYSIKSEIESFEEEVQVYSVLGNVNNKNRIIEVCKTFNVQTIYHTAAYKHVSLVEENPFEAVSNNIHGTKRCVEAAIESNVETFVLISTDKAVRPTNIMGATKRFAELILQSLASTTNTRLTMVRFGNVVGSSGSAIPLFQKQIKEGGPVTVTHREVIRYFMSIPEAAELVIQAGAMGKGGDVFVLDMGEPVKIYELAKRLINLSGMEVKDDNNPDGDIEIIFTGLRPGEKLYEELLIGDNVSTTPHKQIFRAEEEFISANNLQKYLDSLEKAQKAGDLYALKGILEEVVSGYSPEKDIVDAVYMEKN